jgi:hypothetical protein
MASAKRNGNPEVAIATCPARERSDAARRYPAQDVRTKAKTKVKPGYGDRGDQK